MADIDSTVRALADRAAIHDVVLRYARGVDRRDLALVASCFIPGAAYDGGLGQGTIETVLDALRQRLERYESTMHVIGNQLVELLGDHASSETYAVAYHRFTLDNVPKLFTVGVRYLDDIVRQEEGWLIARRSVKTEWQRTE